ncbi:MAG: glycosyltransferase family 39 protein, partial [Candidatus Saccharimonadales bacterium]
MFKTALGWVRQARIHSLLILVCVAAVFGFGLLYHLGTSPNGLSPAGLAYKNSAHSLRTIYHNPLNAPHKVVEYIFIKAGLTGHFPLRLTSAIFALIFIASFYILARNWFGKSIGFFSTILFFSNPILIIAGRQASAEIMFFCPLAIMASYYWLLRDERTKTLAWLVL